MPLRVLIAPDKFKGTLTAAAAAAAIAQGWRTARPGDTLELLPLSDGGDGFGDVLGTLLGAEPRWVETVDAAQRPLRAPWGWIPHDCTAIIETAGTIGLALLPRGAFHPFDLDTRGLGPVFQAAAAAGARRVWVGIGGSATNDGGFGLARALGFRFLDASGAAIECWTALDRLDRIEPASSRLASVELTVAVDVENPLLGPQGASRIYGPQKGLRAEDFARAEACLGRLAAVVARAPDATGLDLALVPGAGAAGGLGFGLMAFLGARFEPGFDVVARCARLEERLRGADLVITGEGAIDASTLMGKGVGRLAQRCRAIRRPCIGLAGRCTVGTDPQTQAAGFTQVRALVPDLAPATEAMQRADYWLHQLAAATARSWPG
jgi:glycerate kinase